MDRISRAHVERILRRDFRLNDLASLFLFAREHSDGRKSVQDIGHFVAHRRKRDTGVVTQSTREWYYSARFFFERMTSEGLTPLLAQQMPSVTKAYFAFASERMPPKTIKNYTGLNRANAGEMLSSIAGRLINNADGTWRLPTDLLPVEMLLIECVTQTLVSRPAFESDMLANDFYRVLKSNGLISREEILENQTYLWTITKLFAVCVMHNCNISIGDGEVVALKAGANKKDKEISVFAPISVTTVEKQVFWASPIFHVSLDPLVHCHEYLANNDEWDFEIELGTDGRICRLA
jgi:hypothetical protein